MIVRERYVPTWRRAKRKRRFNMSLTEPIVIGSLISLLLLLGPLLDGSSLTQAISIQLHEGKVYAWALFACLGLVGIFLMYELVMQRRFGSTLVLTACLVLLGMIAFTDPYSTDHLSYYIGVSLIAIAWLFCMASELDCGWLYKLAGCAFLCVVTSFAALGVCERLLIACLVLGMNVLYFLHLKL